MRLALSQAHLLDRAEALRIAALFLLLPKRHWEGWRSTRRLDDEPLESQKRWPAIPLAARRDSSAPCQRAHNTCVCIFVGLRML